MEFFCFFYDPVDVGNLISGSSVFSKSSLNIWKFTVHVLLKPGLEDFEHYFASMCNKCNYAVVCTFFGIALLWDWNENLLFPVLWPLLSFPNLLACWVQHFNSIIFEDLNSSAGIPSPPLALFVVMLPKAYLTSHSRISSSRWVITPSWLSGRYAVLSPYSLSLSLSLTHTHTHTHTHMHTYTESVQLEAVSDKPV